MLIMPPESKVEVVRLTSLFIDIKINYSSLHRNRVQCQPRPPRAVLLNFEFQLVVLLLAMLNKLDILTITCFGAADDSFPVPL